MREKCVLLALLLIVVTAAPSFAHGPMRFVGVVTSREDDIITVKSAEGKSLTVAIPKGTEITRNNKRAKLSDVKVNSTVILNGLGDHPGNFRVSAIQLVPPITPKKRS